MKRQMLFILAALASFSMVSCSDDVPVSVLCGNGVLDAGEACDGALGMIDCSTLDATKTWKAGGMPTCGASGSANACQILVGSCVEEGAMAICGNGVKEENEQCDGADGLPLTCVDYDSTKTWKTGGAPACGVSNTADACQILVGSCVEEGAMAICGNGVKEENEQCDGADGLPLTCAEFDSTKTWQAGGAPTCGAKDSNAACQILVGSCLEEATTAVCDNGIVEGAEVCDFGGAKSRQCSEIDKKFVSGQAYCNGCKELDLTNCVEAKPICENGIVEVPEVCDFGGANSRLCSEIDPKFVSGAAICTNCKELDLSRCIKVKPVCENGIIEVPEVCDFGGAKSRQCKDIDPKFVSGQALCMNCEKLDLTDCVEGKPFCGNGIVEVPEVCDFGGLESKRCKDIDPKFVSGQAYCNGCKELDLSGCKKLGI